MRGESKQGLVITLVFFILATIGFAVGTYYGFAGQDALEKAAAKAKADEGVITKNREWWKFQALAYRACMGHLPATEVPDLEALRGQFDQNQLGTQEKDQADVRALFQGVLDKKLGWNAAAKKPATTYEDLLNKRDQDIQALKQDIAKLQDDKKKLDNQVKDQGEQLRDMQQDFGQKLKDLSAKMTREQAGDRKTINGLQNAFTEASQQNEQLKKQLQAEQKKRTREITKLNKQVEDQKLVL